MWDDGVPPNPSFILSKFIRVSERLLHLALPFNVHGDVILPYGFAGGLIQLKGSWCKPGEDSGTFPEQRD